MKLSFTIFFTILTLNISSLAHAQTIDKTVVIINDEVVTQNEWNQEFNKIRTEFGQRGKQLPDTPAIRNQVLEKLIMRSILLQKAKRQNIVIAERQIQATLKRIAASNKLSLSDFRQALIRQGGDYNDFYQNIREELTIQQIQRREANRQVTVSEQEIQSAIEQAGLSDNKEYLTAHILLPVPEAASPEQVAEQLNKINTIRQQLNDGAEFDTLAQQFSSGENALEGGDLGWRKQHQMPTLFADIITELKIGEYSNSLRSSSGFHLLHYIDSRDANIVKIPQTEVRHILIKTDALQTEQDVIDKLNSLRDRLLQGEDFATLAQSNSVDHVSASQGGSIGWMSQGETVPAFEEVMNQMKQNEISQPFKSQFGWHILEVTGQREIESPETIQESTIKKQLRKRKTEEAVELWQKRLRDEAYIKFI